jgi:hypothetical protein
MKLVKERIDEADVGDWELTEVTAAGTVTRDQKSIAMGDNIDIQVNHNEELNEFVQGQDPYEVMGLGARDENGNVKIREGYRQICVWPGTVVGKENIEDFVLFFKNDMDIRVQYLEEVITKPGMGGDGGRNDCFFAVHNDDVNKIVMPRLSMGIKWIEDFMMNEGNQIHDDRIKRYIL